MRSYVPKARKAKRELRIRTREKEKGVKRPQDSQKLFMFPFLQTLEQNQHAMQSNSKSWEKKYTILLTTTCSRIFPPMENKAR